MTLPKEEIADPRMWKEVIPYEVGDEVVVHWSPKHTFGLDASAGTTVGVDPEVLALEAVNAALVPDEG